jgi:hypothetical protein
MPGRENLEVFVFCAISERDESANGGEKAKTKEKFLIRGSPGLGEDT